MTKNKIFYIVLALITCVLITIITVRQNRTTISSKPLNITPKATLGGEKSHSADKYLNKLKSFDIQEIHNDAQTSAQHYNQQYQDKLKERAALRDKSKNSRPKRFDTSNLSPEQIKLQQQEINEKIKMEQTTQVYVQSEISKFKQQFDNGDINKNQFDLKVDQLLFDNKVKLDGYIP